MGVRVLVGQGGGIPDHALHPVGIRAVAGAAQSGERMRVVRADQVEEYEHHGQLPEMITLGADVMYDINYDQDGLQEGGTRIDDHEVVARCR
jgi:hypothetical protein